MNGREEPYRSTTSYPHPHPSSDDLSYGGGGGGYPAGPYGPSSSMAYMLPPDMGGMAGPGGLGRPCEMHMNSFAGPMGGVGPNGGHRTGGALTLIRHTITYLLCCGTRGLLSKFPSRAKRIDVISRFIFPLIFAIFNLAYWSNYLVQAQAEYELSQVKKS